MEWVKERIAGVEEMNNIIRKNVYALIYSIEFENNEISRNVLEDYYLTYKGCILRKEWLELATLRIHIKRYFNFKIIKYSVTKEYKVKQ